MVTVCCICRKESTQNGWIERSKEKKGKISHGYCPACYRRIMRAFRLDILSAGPSYKRMMNMKRVVH